MLPQVRQQDCRCSLRCAFPQKHKKLNGPELGNNQIHTLLPTLCELWISKTNPSTTAEITQVAAAPLLLPLTSSSQEQLLEHTEKQ